MVHRHICSQNTCIYKIIIFLNFRSNCKIYHLLEFGSSYSVSVTYVIFPSRALTGQGVSAKTQRLLKSKTTEKGSCLPARPEAVSRGLSCLLSFISFPTHLSLRQVLTVWLWLAWESRSFWPSLLDDWNYHPVPPHSARIPLLRYSSIFCLAN